MALDAPLRIQIRRLLSELKAAQPLRSTRDASRLAGISPARTSWHKNPIVTIALESRMTAVDIVCSPLISARLSRLRRLGLPMASASWRFRIMRSTAKRRDDPVFDHIVTQVVT